MPGVNEMEPLLEFAKEAGRRDVCWRIGCTTCGARELRSGIRHLARGMPLRLFEREEQPQLRIPAVTDVVVEQEPAPWATVLGDSWLHPLTLDDADGLARVSVRPRLEQVAVVAPFPDWLAYLGMILWELGPFENHRFRIGHKWSRDFMNLGGRSDTWTRFERHPMSWPDLERAEAEGLGEYHLRGGRARPVAEPHRRTAAHEFVCPRPERWVEIRRLLTEARDARGDERIPPPPRPLNPGGLLHSRWEQRRRQWVRTVSWANRFGFSQLVPNLAEEDVVRGPA